MTRKKIKANKQPSSYEAHILYQMGLYNHSKEALKEYRKLKFKKLDWVINAQTALQSKNIQDEL